MKSDHLPMPSRFARLFLLGVALSLSLSACALTPKKRGLKGCSFYGTCPDPNEPQHVFGGGGGTVWGESKDVQGN